MEDDELVAQIDQLELSAEEAAALGMPAAALAPAPVVAAALAPHDDEDAAEAERDDYSFEDSEQFEDDSLCSVVTSDSTSGRGDHHLGAGAYSGGPSASGPASGAAWRGWDLSSASGASSSSAAPATTASYSNISPQHPYQEVAGGSRASGTGRSSRSQGGRASASSTNTLRPTPRPQRRAATGNSAGNVLNGDARERQVGSLFTLSAKTCARQLPFCLLEECYNKSMLYRYTRPSPPLSSQDLEMPTLPLEGPQSIPDKIFLAITWWCFPDSDDDIRLYSCLENEGVEEFHRGELLYQSGAVSNAMQIGYHLSAQVVCHSLSNTGFRSEDHLDDEVEELMMESPGGRNARRNQLAEHGERIHNVSLKVDRCRVVWSECSSCSNSWCQHVVALCLFRIRQPQQVEFRVTVWDSINELGSTELKKFAQYLINDLPRKYLPLAQKLLDDLRNPKSSIYHSAGAPDPTDGGHEAVALWSVNDCQLRARISRTLYRFCQPSPTVHCDVQFLSSTQPAIASEWQMLLKPFKSRGPEGLWNLLSIVRAMFQRRDENATTLLHVITDECLASTQVLVWWYVTSLTQSGCWTQSSERRTPHPLLSNQEETALCAAQLCDEMVALWRAAALNPELTGEERRQLEVVVQLYHRTAVDRIWLVLQSCSRAVAATGAGGHSRAFKTSRNNHQHQHHHSGVTSSEYHNVLALLISSVVNEQRQPLSEKTASFSPAVFPGFFSALQACHLSWTPAELGIVTCTRKVSGIPSGTGGMSNAPHLPQLAAAAISLRQPYTICTVLPAATFYYAGGTMHPDHAAVICEQKKGKKKSKHKKSRSSGSGLVGGASAHRPAAALLYADEMPGVQQQQHTRRSTRAVEPIESTESGQESDVAGPSNRLDNQQRHGNAGGGGARRSGSNFPTEDVDLLFASAHAPLDGSELKLARCECLHWHGHGRFAVARAAELASYLRAHLPRLLLLPHDSSILADVEAEGSRGLVPSASTTSASSAASSSSLAPPPSAPRQPPSSKQPPPHHYHHRSGAAAKRRAAAAAVSFSASDADAYAIAAVGSLVPDARLHSLSELTCRTFERALFIAKLLLPYAVHHSALFQLLLDVLSLPRGAMSTKYLQVKLYHLETELCSVLLKMSLSRTELEAIRAKAAGVRGKFGGAAEEQSASGVPPVALARFIFLALVIAEHIDRPSSAAAADEQVALAACLGVLGRSRHESDSGMLAEGLRRQRGDLAFNLLSHYRDSNEKLGLVLDKLLDPNLHRMYSEKHSKTNALHFLEHDIAYRIRCVVRGERPTYPHEEKPPSTTRRDEEDMGRGGAAPMSSAIDSRRPSCEGSSSSSSGSAPDSKSIEDDEECTTGVSAGTARPPLLPRIASHRLCARRSSDEGNESSSSPSQGSLSELSCSTQRTAFAPAHHSASNKRGGRHFASSSTGGTPSCLSSSGALEAHAHYMTELAKNLLEKLAGGTQSTVMFTAAPPSHQPQNQHGPHRKLHMCAFLTGLYALGLSNAASRSWQSRTYSTHVSWLVGQALDIGPAALEVLRHTWPAHLTPPEAANLADKASQSRDPAAVTEGALLALSVLGQADALGTCEGQRALEQCRDQTPAILEQALATVDLVSKTREVFPEILFSAAHMWAEIASEDGGPANSYFGGLHQHAARSHPHNHQRPPPPMASSAAAAAAASLYRHLPLQVPVSVSSTSGVAAPSMSMPPPMYAHAHQQQLQQQHFMMYPPPSPGAHLVVGAAAAAQFAARGNSGGLHQQFGQGPSGGEEQHADAYPTSSRQQPPVSTAPPTMHFAAPPGMRMSPQPMQNMHTSHSAPELLPRGVRSGISHDQYSVQHLQQQQRQQQLAHQLSANYGGVSHSTASTSASSSAMPQSIALPQPQSTVPSGQPPNTAPAPLTTHDPRLERLVRAQHIGLRAMEVIAKRSNEDRSFSKFTENSPFAVDIRWLFELSCKIGAVALVSFCDVAARTVTSPFLLHELAVKTMSMFPAYPGQSQLRVPGVHSIRHPHSSTAPGGVMRLEKCHVRSVLVAAGHHVQTAELLEKCVEMLFLAVSTKLSHPKPTQSDYEEVCSMVSRSREVFRLLPGGWGHFDEFIKHVRAQKSCKKELTQRIQDIQRAARNTWHAN